MGLLIIMHNILVFTLLLTTYYALFYIKGDDIKGGKNYMYKMWF